MKSSAAWSIPPKSRYRKLFKSPSKLNTTIAAAPRIQPSQLILQQKSACACGGGCARCRQTPVLQAKFAISSPNDKYEKEADRIADKVMSAPASSIKRKPG